MTITTKSGDQDEKTTYEVKGTAGTAWSVGCLAVALLAFVAVIAVLALPIAALYRLIMG